MQDVSVALLWHQHQPYYVDDLSPEVLLPWVRLHASRDYWGMAMQLLEFPQMHATVNLTPCLVKQLLAQANGESQDIHLRVSQRPPDGLTEEESVYLMDNFFMVHQEHNIRPNPRYAELHAKRNASADSAKVALKRFSRQDIIDLQCWSNLVWIHPLAFEQDKDLAEFKQKGTGWSVHEKNWLLAKQHELLSQVVPLYRQLSERGQVELTTSPFYHAILPLLWDKRSALNALPQLTLPLHLKSFDIDVCEQVRRAIDFHTEVFGTKPRGMWPSEGSVSQAIVAPLVDAGVQWIASDEEVLAESLSGQLARNEKGELQNASLLYRPWNLQDRGRKLVSIFRDHQLSDLISFQYQRYSAQRAVDDLVGRLQAIAQAGIRHTAAAPALVTLAMDGDNCWEHYPDCGVKFLRGLYRTLSDHRDVKPVCVADYIEQHPPKKSLAHLHAGSWIKHDFSVWIGHTECNLAWDLLHDARQLLVERAEEESEVTDNPVITNESLQKAWEEIYQAQGSDWFWWLGDSHTSSQDEIFDQLFRSHLSNVYTLLGESPPKILSQPIVQQPPEAIEQEPTQLLDVRIDGRRTYFEWIGAGYHKPSRSRGTMMMASVGRTECVYFGFDREHLLIRLDAQSGPIWESWDDVDALHIVFTEPNDYRLTVQRPATEHPAFTLTHGNVVVSHSHIEVAANTVLEIDIPWLALAVSKEGSIRFHVELLQGDSVIERVPYSDAISLRVPSPSFEMTMWHA